MSTAQKDPPEADKIMHGMLVSSIYRALRYINDVNAVSKGKVGRRVGRRIYGKAAGRLARKLFG